MNKFPTKCFGKMTFLVSIWICTPACQKQAMVGQEHLKQESTDLSGEMKVVGRSLALQPSDHLKYFGFYYSGANPAIASFANVYWVVNHTDNNANLAELQQARTDGKKVILDVSPYFFDSNRNYYYNTVPTTWNTFASLITPYVNDGTIVAFYSLDEPFLQAHLNTRISGAGHRTWQSMFQDLVSLGNAVKGWFPNVPIALNNSGISIANGTFALPPNYDWFAFDIYDCWQSCANNLSYADLYNIMVSKMTSPNQRTFVMPDTWMATPGDNSSNADRIALFNSYVTFAANHPSVIGIFNFIYQNVSSNKGVSSMPALLSAVQAVGQQFVPSCNSHVFLGGGQSVSTFAPGQNFIVACNYGAVLDSIRASVGDGICSFAYFSGTAAQFNCTAPWVPGSFPVSCQMVAGTRSNSCAQSNPIGTANLIDHTNSGWLDGVTINSDGSVSIYGWACEKQDAASIDVHVYLGGAAGAGGTFLTASQANLPSEPAIAQACQSTGQNYRFNIRVAASVVQANRGKAVFVHGINRFGYSNAVIGNSGSFFFPQ